MTIPRITEAIRLGQAVHVVNEADVCLAGTVAGWDPADRTVTAVALHVGEAGFAAWLPHRDLTHDPAGSDGGTFHLPDECPWLR
ncbi:MAG: hypothetical protein ACHQNA_14645 [Acidimicrobiales bacterium]